jgi:hypothetical protein
MRGRRLWSLLAGLLVIAILAPPYSLSAATLVLQDVNTEDYPQVRLDVALTADLVPEAGEPRFTVLENGIEATGVRVQVQAEERGPVDVVLLFDESGSMRGEPLEAGKTAARSFIQAMRPDDRVAIVAFSSEPRVLTDFTSDSAVLMGAVDALSASGETALYDGLIRAARACSRKARRIASSWFSLMEGTPPASTRSIPRLKRSAACGSDGLRGCTGVSRVRPRITRCSGEQFRRPPCLRAGCGQSCHDIRGHSEGAQEPVHGGLHERPTLDEGSRD